MTTLRLWILVMCWSCLGLGSSRIWAQNPPTITVNGEAISYVQPDKVLITFGADTFDKEVSISKKKNNELISKAFAVLKEQGVPASDVQTDYLRLEPTYSRDYNTSKSELIGYTSSNAFVVTLTDIKKLEPVITALLLAGINRMQGIEFQTTELKTHREKARELALLAAKEKAEKMSATLECKIAGPIQITENSSSYPWAGSSRANAMTQNAAVTMPGGESEGTETVSLGKIAIKANVSVTFLLRTADESSKPN